MYNTRGQDLDSDDRRRIEDIERHNIEDTGQSNLDSPTNFQEVIVVPDTLPTGDHHSKPASEGANMIDSPEKIKEIQQACNNEQVAEERNANVLEYRSSAGPADIKENDQTSIKSDKSLDSLRYFETESIQSTKDHSFSVDYDENIENSEATRQTAVSSVDPDIKNTFKSIDDSLKRISKCNEELSKFYY